MWLDKTMLLGLRPVFHRHKKTHAEVMLCMGGEYFDYAKELLFALVVFVAVDLAAEVIFITIEPPVFTSGEMAAMVGHVYFFALL